MLYKLLKYITKSNNNYYDYQQRRITLDSVMITMTNEWVNSCKRPEADSDFYWKKVQEATSIRDKFCNNHLVYTKIYDYIFKKEMKKM